MPATDHDSADHDWESCATCVDEAKENEILGPDAKPHLTPAELKELDTLVNRLADAIVRALLEEVNDPLVRRQAIRRAADRLAVGI